MRRGRSRFRNGNCWYTPGSFRIRIIHLTKVRVCAYPPIRRAEAVTIIAGFKGYDGIVLCADTQETVQGFKRKVPKLRVEPAKVGGDLAVAFCGAGHGPFIDKVVDR